MSGPNRSRPTSSSPIKLEAAVEEVLTPATISKKPDAPVAQTAPLPASTPKAGEKRAITIGLNTLLKKRVETAVLRTAGEPEGYVSMAALIEGALENELARLEAKYNQGVPFPPNEGGFRMGRPLGS